MTGPVVPPGGGVPVDPETGERYGYLPPRAANRKLIIRAQLGLPWVLAALGAAAVLAVAAAAFVLSRPTHPGKPYVDAGALSRYAEQDVTPLPDRTGWVDRRRGLAVVSATYAFCLDDGGWVDPEGRRYDFAGRSDTGRGVTLFAVRAAAGHVWVDRTHTVVVAEAAEPLAPCTLKRAVTDPAPPDGL